MASRTPPAHVRRFLRKEVNFGCPVENCGINLLGYHHFDPPYEPTHHQDPKGMIALCANHHEMADGNKWSKAELHQMKNKPWLSEPEIRADIGRKREDIFLLAGSNLMVGRAVFLAGNGHKMLGISRSSDGRLQLDISIRNISGTEVISMVDGDWLEVPRGIKIDDADFGSQGKSSSLRLLGKSIEFDLAFPADLDAHQLNKYLARNGIEPMTVTPVNLEMKFTVAHIIRAKWDWPQSFLVNSKGLYVGDLFIHNVITEKTNFLSVS